MKRKECSQEAAVLKAVRTGSWDETLKAHASKCPICWEVLQTASWMQVLARESEKVPAPREASLLWWRAQLSERQAKVDRAQEIGEWGEILSGAAVAAGAAAWAAWNWPSLQGRMTQLFGSFQSSMATYSTPILLLSFVAALGLALGVLTSPVLRDE